MRSQTDATETVCDILNVILYYTRLRINGWNIFYFLIQRATLMVKVSREITFDWKS
jgi:hypothetical protein